MRSDVITVLTGSRPTVRDIAAEAQRLSGNWVGAERHAETRRWKVLDK